MEKKQLKKVLEEKLFSKFGKIMSKLARIPVVIKQGVIVVYEDSSIKISGPKGTLSFKIPNGVSVKTEGDLLRVMPKDKAQDVSAILGLTRATIANMINGVNSGFEKKLELSGVGYRAAIVGKDLVLTVGFSHPVKILALEGINYSVSDNIITVFGIDPNLVGNTAARIRAVKPPEPYRGKGIKYQNEKIRRKAGKAAKAVGTK